MAFDPNFANVSLLLHFDGANNSTSFIDKSVRTKAVTAVGDSKISTADSVFGGGCGKFDGAGDYLTIPTHEDFSFGNQDFCIELRVRFDVVPGAGSYAALVSRRTSGTSNNSFTFWYGGTEKFYFSYSLNGTTQVSTVTLNDTVPVAGQWYAAELSRYGGEIRVRINGVAGSNSHTIGTSSIFDGGMPLMIGAANTANAYHLNGAIDELRITKGVARNTANYTPATAPFPDNGPGLRPLVLLNGALVESPVNEVIADDLLTTREAAISKSIGYAKWTGTAWTFVNSDFVAVGGALGTPASGDLSNCTADGTNPVGFRNIPQNSKSAAYTCVLADAGKHLLHPSADTTARTFTIPANSSVAYPIGTALTFINQNGAGVVTIAITTDTMRLAGAGTTGSRTLAANGVATAVKITATEWIISGAGLT